MFKYQLYKPVLVQTDLVLIFWCQMRQWVPIIVMPTIHSTNFYSASSGFYLLIVVCFMMAQKLWKKIKVCSYCCKNILQYLIQK